MNPPPASTMSRKGKQQQRTIGLIEEKPLVRSSSCMTAMHPSSSQVVVLVNTRRFQVLHRLQNSIT